MFGDIMDRIPVAARDEMQQHMLSQDHTSQEIEEQHMQMFKKMMVDPQKYFPLDATSQEVLTDSPKGVCSDQQQQRASAI